MHIQEIIIGVESGRAVQWPLYNHTEAILVTDQLPFPPEALVEKIAALLSGIITHRGPEFIRATVQLDAKHELILVDDRTQHMRSLLERDSNMAVFELELADDDTEDAHETFRNRLALALGLVDLDMVATLLARKETSTKPPSENLDPGKKTHTDASVTEWRAAHTEAERTAAAIRHLDARMTASVVPNWLWFATTGGGLAVFLTTVPFLFPTARVFLLPLLVTTAVLGLGWYAYRSWGELRVRAALQLERHTLREKREQARAQRRELSEALTAQGIDLAALLRESRDAPENFPRVHLGEPLTPYSASASKAAVHNRPQTLWITDQKAAVEDPRFVPYVDLAAP